MSEPADNTAHAPTPETGGGETDASLSGGEQLGHLRASGFSFGAADVPVRHAFRDLVPRRRGQHSIVVHVEDADGVVGIGEGVTLEETSGETLASALSFLHRRRHTLSALASPDHLARWCARNAAEIDRNPAAYCAAEMALIDLFAKQGRRNIETMFAAPPSTGELQLTALVGGKSGYRFRLQQAVYARLRPPMARLRLTGKAGVDLKRASQLVKSGRVYVDARGLWPDANTAVAALAQLKPYIWGVVDPVAVRDWSAMDEVAERTGLTVLADAGVVGISDISAMPRATGIVPVVSVAKMGGLMRAVSSLRTVIEQDRNLVVGAAPGESSILARAGAMLALGAGDKLMAFEGGQGRSILARDLVDPTIAAGETGRIRLSEAVARPGLGLSLRADARQLLRAPQNADYWMPSAEPR